MIDFLRDFLRFAIGRKKLWLIPLAFLIALFGLLFSLSHNPNVAPFVYTLF